MPVIFDVHVERPERVHDVRHRVQEDALQRREGRVGREGHGLAHVGRNGAGRQGRGAMMTMMRRVWPLVVLTFAFAAPASAQQTVGDIVTFLVTNQAVRTSDAQSDRAAADAARDTIARALLLNLTSSSLASSSSGFLYKLNPR